MKQLIYIFLSAFCLICSVACKTEGPAERTGSKIDNAIDNIKEGEDPFKEKGVFEKVGEDIDQATKKDNK